MIELKKVTGILKDLLINGYETVSIRPLLKNLIANQKELSKLRKEVLELKIEIESYKNLNKTK